MAGLALERVTKRFGRRAVVDDMSFAVDDGEMLTILGPSGAGKTSLLRAIAGLDPIDGGRISLAGRDITRAAPRERNIGLVFQDFALFPHLSVRANIGFGVRTNRRTRVLEVAEALRIVPLLERYPAHLSGGERQRVAIARALATRPAALLFDEPFASLDAPLRALLRTELADMRAQATMPAIFVTHDQAEALALGDRVAIVENGRIVALDTPEALTATPPTAFVARFVGRPPANVFDGAVRAGRFAATGQPQIGCDGVDARVAAIAVRPERVTIDRQSSLVGRVRLVETIGAQRYATLVVGDLTIVALADLQTAVGTAAGIAIDYAQMWTYDRDGRHAG